MPPEALFFNWVIASFSTTINCESMCHGESFNCQCWLSQVTMYHWYAEEQIHLSGELLVSYLADKNANWEVTALFLFHHEATTCWHHIWHDDIFGNGDINQALSTSPGTHRCGKGVRGVARLRIQIKGLGPDFVLRPVFCVRNLLWQGTTKVNFSNSEVGETGKNMRGLFSFCCFLLPLQPWKVVNSWRVFMAALVAEVVSQLAGPA